MFQFYFNCAGTIQSKQLAIQHRMARRFYFANFIQFPVEFLFFCINRNRVGRPLL